MTVPTWADPSATWAGVAVWSFPFDTDASSAPNATNVVAAKATATPAATSIPTTGAA